MLLFGADADGNNRNQDDDYNGNECDDDENAMVLLCAMLGDSA